MLDSLEKNGLIQRVVSKTDARFKEIVLTEKANDLKKDVYRDIDSLEKQIVKGLSAEQLRVWQEISEKMIENLKED